MFNFMIRKKIQFFCKKYACKYITNTTVIKVKCHKLGLLSVKKDLNTGFQFCNYFSEEEMTGC